MADEFRSIIERVPIGDKPINMGRFRRVVHANSLRAQAAHIPGSTRIRLRSDSRTSRPNSHLGLLRSTRSFLDSLVCLEAKQPSFGYPS
jgi:hypothetical protein